MTKQFSCLPDRRCKNPSRAACVFTHTSCEKGRRAKKSDLINTTHAERTACFGTTVSLFEQSYSAFGSVV